MDAPEMPFEDYMSSDFYNSALLNFLDLCDPCMDAFRRRLCKKLAEKNFYPELKI